LIVVVVLAATRVMDAAIPREQRVAWVLAVLLTLSLSQHFWSGPADLRALSDVYLLSAVLLLARPSAGRSARPSRRLGERLPDGRRLVLAAAPVAATFGLTFLARIVEL
jgi:hypothetical protein